MADLLPPWQRGLLRTIYGSESAYPGRDPYRVMYGGRTVDDFSDHPRQLMPIVSGPNATSRSGLRTSAAGGYQFLRGSWDEARNALGLPDFSPLSQDRAAIWHAERAYKGRTGRDLGTDIEEAKGDPQKLTAVGRGLSGWWTSLPGGIEPNRATGSFGDRFVKQLNYAATEGDTEGPALYSPMAFSGSHSPVGGSMTPKPNQFALLPQASDTLSVPEQYRQPPVNFTDDPLAWIRGRNSAGYDIPSHLLSAAAGLASVNNPQGAAVLSKMAQSDDEQFTAHMDANGNVLQVGDKGTLRQWRVPTALKAAETAGSKALADADAKRWSSMKGDIFDGAEKAGGRLSDLNTLEAALKHPGLYQGPGGTQVQEFKKFVAANPTLKGLFGDSLDLSSVSAGDIANRIQAMGILQMRDPKGGYGGMPGAFTEKEWDRLAKANAGLDNSFEGNLLTITSERIMRERQKQMGDWLTNYLDLTGGAFDDVSWQRYKQRMIKENPVPDFEKIVRDTYAKVPSTQAQPAAPASSTSSWSTAPGGTKYRMVE